jgi:GH24 family phage-related lysozyme (muramidase)
VDADLRAELERDEGGRQYRGGDGFWRAYTDSRGYFTIGVGHLLGDSPRMTRISDREVEALLEADVQDAVVLARSCIPLFDQLDWVRRRALINMAFNRGEHMRDSTTITPAINWAARTGVWGEVGVAILGDPIQKRSPSQWATQVKDRASRLAFMLVNGRVA